MHSKTAISCEQLGLDIANINGAIKRISELKYVVKSQSGNGDCEVNSTDLGWVCACPDHKYRGVKCKHIFAVEISFALHKEVEVARIGPIDVDCCIYCKSSWIVKDGRRHNKYRDIQKFNCRDCNSYFTINLGFERDDDEAIIRCLKFCRQDMMTLASYSTISSKSKHRDGFGQHIFPAKISASYLSVAIVDSYIAIVETAFACM